MPCIPKPSVDNVLRVCEATYAIVWPQRTANTLVIRRDHCRGYYLLVHVFDHWIVWLYFEVYLCNLRKQKMYSLQIKW